MANTAIAMMLVVMLGLTFVFVFGALPKFRIARRKCSCCGQRFGRASVTTEIPYYERVYGVGMKVMGGPRRYLGARVIACVNCRAEFVFSSLGGYVEPLSGEDLRIARDRMKEIQSDDEA